MTDQWCSTPDVECRWGSLWCRGVQRPEPRHSVLQPVKAVLAGVGDEDVRQGGCGETPPMVRQPEQAASELVGRKGDGGDEQRPDRSVQDQPEQHRGDVQQAVVGRYGGDGCAPLDQHMHQTHGEKRHGGGNDDAEQHGEGRPKGRSRSILAPQPLESLKADQVTGVVAPPFLPSGIGRGVTGGACSHPPPSDLNTVTWSEANAWSESARARSALTRLVSAFSRSR